MSERSLQLDALRDICSPEKIASLFRMLGYNADAQPLEVIHNSPELLIVIAPQLRLFERQSELLV